MLSDDAPSSRAVGTVYAKQGLSPLQDRLMVFINVLVKGQKLQENGLSGFLS